MKVAGQVMAMVKGNICQVLVEKDTSPLGKLHGTNYIIYKLR